ncbi:hypothetical protein HDG37_004118 [Paraburkholderia sp. MM5384-R2]|nr:hypothetical protein [Paraburkholderia sp. MM5384-R2]
MHSNLAGCFGEPGFVARRTSAGANRHRAAPPRAARRKPATAFAGGRFQASSRNLFIAVRSFIAVFLRIALAAPAPWQVRACASRSSPLTANRYSPPQVPKTLTFATSMRGAPTLAPSPRAAPGPFPPAVAPDVYHSHLAPFLRQRFPHCRTLGRDPFATRFRTRRERRPIRARARFSQLDAAAPRAATGRPRPPGTA